jgi:hypothetical protein
MKKGEKMKRERMEVKMDRDEREGKGKGKGRDTNFKRSGVDDERGEDKKVINYWSREM